MSDVQLPSTAMPTDSTTTVGSKLPTVVCPARRPRPTTQMNETRESWPTIKGNVLGPVGPTRFLQQVHSEVTRHDACVHSHQRTSKQAHKHTDRLQVRWELEADVVAVRDLRCVQHLVVKAVVHHAVRLEHSDATRNKHTRIRIRPTRSVP